MLISVLIRLSRIVVSSRMVTVLSSSWPSATTLSTIFLTMARMFSGVCSSSERTEASAPSASIRMTASLDWGFGPRLGLVVKIGKHARAVVLRYEIDDLRRQIGFRRHLNPALNMSGDNL